jgi:hypothetical protein
MDSYQSCGIIGAVLYAPLLIASLYCVYSSVYAVKEAHFKYRIYFHSVFTTYCILELLYFISMIICEKYNILYQQYISYYSYLFVYYYILYMCIDILYGDIHFIYLHYLCMLLHLLWY